MNGRNNFVKRDESVGNLNDLLESLNKSNGGAGSTDILLALISNESEKQGNSTASDTAGS